MPEEISFASTAFADSITLKQSLWLYALVSGLEQGVLLVNDEQQILFVNQQLCKIFQLQQLPGTFVGQQISALLNRAAGLFSDSSSITQQLKAVIDHKKPAYKEKVILTDNRILSADFIPIWLDKNISGNLVLFRDDTLSIRTAESLETDKKFFQDILNHLPEEVAVYSAYFKYKYVNPQGVSDELERKWLMGKTDMDYFVLRNKDAETARTRTKYFEKVITEKKEIAWEETIVSDQGVPETFLRKLHPVMDEKGDIQQIIGYGINITGRKENEKRLQAREKRYRELVTYSRSILCTHDGSGTILSTNPALLEITGYTEPEIIGRKLQDFMSTEDAEKFQESFLEPIAGSRQAEGLFCIIRKSGERIYLSYQNYKVEEPGVDPYFVASAQDITERVIAEQNLREAQLHTQETARSREKFLADMSHEIRTPMNGILGISTLLQKTNLTSDQQFYLQIIQESAQKLLGMINSIHEITGSTEGKTEFSAEVKVDSQAEILTSYPETEKPTAMIYPSEERIQNTKLPNLRVLLAEDNDINQFLAKNMLRHWGFECSVANTGEEVLDLLREKDFDLILMDIQMPVKNGVEVTQEIRQFPNPEKRNIPIIALTALTVKGDEKKYLAAGMNACLTKPFKEKELFQTIERLFEEKENEKATTQTQTEPEAIPVSETGISNGSGVREFAAPEEVEEQQEIIPEPVTETEEESDLSEEDAVLYDLSYLRSIQGSSTELVNKLMEIFIRTVPPTASEMVQASETEDWDTVKKLAHKIKSSVNTMGLHSIKADVKQIEESAGSRQQLESIPAKAKHIENIVTIASRQLQAELESQLSINHS